MLKHRFIDELIELEQNHTFCGRKVTGHNRVLVIGTFNPDDKAYPDPTNNAEWFYGRTDINKFWHYFPSAFTGNTLHPAYVQNGGVQTWKEYCMNNKVVIIDMLKIIQSNKILTSQKDIELEGRIQPRFQNVDYFKVDKAFDSSTFDLVVYSLLWSQADKLPNLVALRNYINQQLLIQGTIQSSNQIKYCNTPWMDNVQQSWNKAFEK